MESCLAASTGWYVGLALGLVVVFVAALIVIVIVTLAQLIAHKAEQAVGGVEAVRAQTDSESGALRREAFQDGESLFLTEQRRRGLGLLRERSHRVHEHHEVGPARCRLGHGRVGNGQGVERAREQRDGGGDGAGLRHDDQPRAVRVAELLEQGFPAHQHLR